MKYRLSFIIGHCIAYNNGVCGSFHQLIASKTKLPPNHYVTKEVDCADNGKDMRRSHYRYFNAAIFRTINSGYFTMISGRHVILISTGHWFYKHHYRLQGYVKCIFNYMYYGYCCKLMPLLIRTYGLDFSLALVKTMSDAQI